MVENAENSLAFHDAIGFSIITYYEILNGLLYKDVTGISPKKNASFGETPVSFRIYYFMYININPSAAAY